nr:hypothetical protein [Tanacetum cinerariifolium]
MADLKFVDQHNMVAYLEKSDDDTEFHPIVDFLSSCLINYALTQIHAIVDSKVVVILESSVRSDLLFDDEDGTPTQTRCKRVLEQPNEPPLSKGHTSGSGVRRMEHTFELKNTVPPTPHDLPLTEGYTPGSDEEPSLDIEDSPKQERMVDKLDKDENVNLFSEQGEVHETAKPLNDDDATLAETLLNIKRSTTKDKRKDKREEDVDKGDQTQDIDWNDPKVLRYHALQNRVFSNAEVRKNMCTYLKNRGGYKQSYFKGMKYEDIRPIFERKQKLDEQTEEEVEAQVDSDQEVGGMKLYMRIVPDEEIAIDAIPLSTKPSVIAEYKIVKEGKIRIEAIGLLRSCIDGWHNSSIKRGASPLDLTTGGGPLLFGGGEHAGGSH